MADTTVARTVTVTNLLGLHVRPADLFAKLANRYQSKIEVIKENQRVDGKSILDVLSLYGPTGTQLKIEATGPDAQDAVTALVQLVERNFDE